MCMKTIDVLAENTKIIWCGFVDKVQGTQMNPHTHTTMMMVVALQVIPLRL